MKAQKLPPIVLRADERGVLVPCSWDMPRWVVPVLPPDPLPLQTLGVLQQGVRPLEYRAVTFHRHEVHLARRWAPWERRALARAGARGRRGARSVPAEHRDVAHVYLPEGQQPRAEHRAVALGLLHERTPQPWGRS